jgi:hypothetical protein
MSEDWAPHIGQVAQACLDQLPWWGRGWTGNLNRGEGQDPVEPGPLPPITDAYFREVLRPELYKCPSVVANTDAA